MWPSWLILILTLCFSFLIETRNNPTHRDKLQNKRSDDEQGRAEHLSSLVLEEFAKHIPRSHSKAIDNAAVEILAPRNFVAKAPAGEEAKLESHSVRPEGVKSLAQKKGEPQPVSTSCSTTVGGVPNADASANNEIPSNVNPVVVVNRPTGGNIPTNVNPSSSSNQFLNTNPSSSFDPVLNANPSSSSGSSPNTATASKSSSTQRNTSNTRRGTSTSGSGAPETSAGDEDGNTTTVDLATFTNSTITIRNPTSPTSPLTPVPEATDFVLDEVTYQFLKIKSNATSYIMGGLLPITAGGKPWLSGVQFVEAFKCQLNILNSNSRVLPVSFITYLIQNSDLLTSTATKQAYLLLQKNVFMTVGPTTNDQIPSVGYLNAPEMLAFNSFDASSVLLANSTTYPSFFRTIPSDNFQARAMAETCKIFDWTFVAALFTTDSYGTSGRTAFLSQTGRQRIKVTCSNSIQPGSTNGLSSFADCVAGSDASVVLLWMDETNAANTLSYLYRNATNTRLTFLASDRWAHITDPVAFNTTVLQRTGLSFPLSFLEGSLGFIPQIGQLGQYRACASIVNPENTDYPEFSQVWEDSFKCKFNASDTLPLCPEEVESRTFECRCIGDENFADLPPRVNYVQDAVNIMYTALDTLFNPTRCAKLRVPSLCNLTYFTPADYVQALSLASITGLTGPIQFNVTQPDRRRANFDIYQYRDDGVSEQVGYWNITSPYLAANLLQFKTSPDYPTSFLVPQTTEWSSGAWPKVVAIMSALGILLSLAFLIFFTIFSASRVVQRTNLLWLWLFVSGIILVLLSCLIWTFRQTAATCTTKSLLMYLGFALITACIVVKVQRIFRVLVNAGKVSMVLGTAELLFVVGLVLLPALIIMFYYILAGGVPQATITQSSVDNTYLFISCVPANSSNKSIALDIFIGYVLFLIVLSTILLLLSRKLQTVYSEAEYLFLVCLDVIILSIIMIPLYFTVGEYRGSVLQTFLLRSLAILFALYLTLALICFPKFIAIVNQVKAKKKRQAEEQSLGGSVASPRYVELATSDDSEPESDLTTTSKTDKPGFISQTNSRKSGSGTATPTGTTSGTLTHRSSSASKSQFSLQ